MNISSKLLYIITTLALTTAAFAANAWDLRKDKDGIQVYTRSVEGSAYKEVKTETIVADIRLSSLAALIIDVEACPDWADKCAESYVYEQINETESYVYTHNKMPFPVKDRDVLAHMKWQQNPTTNELVLASFATTDIMPKKKKRLRLTEAKTGWYFTPQPDGNIRIVNEAHINPGSSLPGWVTNMLLVDTPFKTMLSFIKEARNPKYRDAQISFITEPAASNK